LGVKKQLTKIGETEWKADQDNLGGWKIDSQYAFVLEKFQSDNLPITICELTDSIEGRKFNKSTSWFSRQNGLTGSSL
jgi:hypothetical protein